MNKRELKFKQASQGRKQTYSRLRYYLVVLVISLCSILIITVIYYNPEIIEPVIKPWVLFLMDLHPLVLGLIIILISVVITLFWLGLIFIWYKVGLFRLIFGIKSIEEDINVDEHS